MSNRILTYLRGEVRYAMSSFTSAQESRVRAEADLKHAENMIASMRASGNLQELAALNEKHALCKQAYDTEVWRAKKAENILEDVCADICQYAIDVCVPHQWQKSVQTDYVAGGSVVHLFFNERHCIFDLCTKEFNYVKKANS